MDVETGERSRDSETGEWISNQRDEHDNETGEPDVTTYKKRTKFRIPSSYIKTKKQYFTTETCRDLSPALLIMLPTLFVYPALTTVIIAIVEVTIHIWAHRKNKTIADKSVYYKSPMHIIASEFCAKCRDIKSMNKIERLQDKRTLRLRCNYDYVKRIVT